MMEKSAVWDLKMTWTVVNKFHTGPKDADITYLSGTH